MRELATDTAPWTDDAWVVDSTPVECGHSRKTVRRSDLAGWAQYGYCASHPRHFWGLRLHLLCTLGGLPIAFALTGAKADELCRRSSSRSTRPARANSTSNATAAAPAA